MKKLGKVLKDIAYILLMLEWPIFLVCVYIETNNTFIFFIVYIFLQILIHFLGDAFCIESKNDARNN